MKVRENGKSKCNFLLGKSAALLLGKSVVEGVDYSILNVTELYMTCIVFQLLPQVEGAKLWKCHVENSIPKNGLMIPVFELSSL